MELNVLFVSHDAFRAGATIVLKHHLDALKKRGAINFDIGVLNSGVLIDEFKKLGKVFFLRQPNKNRILSRTLQKLKVIPYQPYLAINLSKYQVIYGNTVVSCNYLKFVKQKDSSKITVCHIHEMDYSIKLYQGKASFLSTVPYIDLFIAASISVKDNLVNNYNIPENKIVIHYEYIPLPQHGVTNSTLNLNKLKICGCGTLDWRKGIDVFIRAAYQLKKVLDPDAFHFYWLGAHKNLDYERALFDIQKMGLNDQVTIIESTPEPFKVIGECNMFFLTSREDPFPLVCLEAASLGLPIVCFEGSGGMTEFVNESNGWVIPYLDMDAFSEVCKNVVQSNTGVLHSKGLQASADVKNYDINIGANLLENILLNINSYLKN